MNQLQHDRTSSHFITACGQKILSDEILQQRAFARTLQEIATFDQLLEIYYKCRIPDLPQRRSGAILAKTLRGTCWSIDTAC